MAKSRRQAGLIKRGRDEELSNRFEARVKKAKKRRKGEKAGRKAARGKR